MLVHDYEVTIDVDENTVEMMKYCNSHLCEGHGCPYWNECQEFELKYETIPYLFCTEDESPWRVFEN